jgi:uncharacterized protein YcfJ
MKAKASIAPLALTGAVLAIAQPALAASSYDTAQVLSSTPIYRVVEISTPQQECWEEEVVRQQHRRHNDSATPGLLGMVIGGALGNAVGSHKSSQRVGAVVGAMLGGSIARDIVRNNDNNRATVYVDTVERCRTVRTTRQEEKLVGYDVSYSYNGAQHTVRMPEDPGNTVRVRVDVEPVL